MTWTGQTFTVGQVLTAAQMNNLQADITAALAGDTGAPRVAGKALNAWATGDYQLYPQTGGSANYASATKTVELVVPAAGTINVWMQLENGSKSGTVYGQIYVNGVAAGTLRTMTWPTASAEYEEDITVVAGDLVQLYCYRGGATLVYAYIKLLVSAGTMILPGQHKTYP